MQDAHQPRRLEFVAEFLRNLETGERQMFTDPNYVDPRHIPATPLAIEQRTLIEDVIAEQQPYLDQITEQLNRLKLSWFPFGEGVTLTASMLCERIPELLLQRSGLPRESTLQLNLAVIVEAIALLPEPALGAKRIQAEACDDNPDETSVTTPVEQVKQPKLIMVVDAAMRDMHKLIVKCPDDLKKRDGTPNISAIARKIAGQRNAAGRSFDVLRATYNRWRDENDL